MTGATPSGSGCQPDGLSPCGSSRSGIPSAEALSKGRFRGPTKFYDGRGGWARQDFESVDNPRFGYAWQRENRKDRGRQWWMVDGQEVKDFAEADKLLADPPASDSPSEQFRREMEEFSNSPKIGVSRALAEARCNADVGPFGGVRAANQRVGHPWHVGINRYSDQLRAEGKPFPSGLYNAKTAAYEAFRAQYLWSADREKDTGLKCALGTKCRSCPILQSIESACIESRDAEKFGHPEIEVEDIDFAKTWTCIGHILQEKPDGYFDGAFFSTTESRKDRMW